MSDVIVKESKIHGKGVFAARDFKKGESITKWDTSRTMTKEELQNASKEDKRYITVMNGKTVVMQEPERYVNHSCNPNTIIKNFSDVARRDIKTGEEITGNYLEEGSLEVPFVCNCGSDNCRGKIWTK
jgi:SET domain-containing protein